MNLQSSAFGHHLNLSFKRFEILARGSKWYRLIQNPYKYLSAVGFRNIIYPRQKKAVTRKARLFFGKPMMIALPAATDIYITGGKTHDSEIRLTKFLLKNLKEGDYFLDIGAHYGYYSLLASELVGDKGKVMAFEPASEAFSILNENSRGKKNITVFKRLVSDSNEAQSFYEFSNLYSEYNSFQVFQYKDKEWFNSSMFNESIVESITIDEITSGNFKPTLVKIDVEGGEYKVILGASGFLDTGSCKIAMEYLHPERDNKQHQLAVGHLKTKGYFPFIIDREGNLKKGDNLDQYLTDHKLESDNIVFQKVN